MKLIKAPFLLFFFSVFFSSCVDNVSFDDVTLDNLAVIDSPLFYFTVQQSSFVDEVNLVEVLSYTHEADVSFIGEKNLSSTLHNLGMSFTFDNEIDRKFVVNILFFDENDNIVYQTYPITIEPNEQNVVASRLIPESGIAPFLQSKTLKVYLTMTSNGNLLDTSLPNKFSMRSIAHYYLKN